MSVEEQISELIDKYEGLNARRLKQFNEENTKKDFILPLFKHLGWDVTNSDEVAAEEKSSNGRVDYAFKIGGVSKFYLEAKPLREDLNQRPDWAKQVITYAENKGVTWAVLTNFKQLMVFNAEWDKPALERARFLNLTYREYLLAFHKLWWLSRDSVEKGMLDEEARQVGALKPKLPVEKSLLDQLLRWRGELFNQIYQHNKDRGLDFLQVDELIQHFINRLIFIRSTEDRGIEENRLRAALHQWRDSGRKGELVERMRAIFHEFATLYDSDLFPPLDTWDSLIVESDTIEKIIEGSYERSNRLAGYDFAAIDPKVWGAVYEQYLGYVAQEAKEEAKKGATQARLLGLEAPVFELEARRIKRKQQGIYYTPESVTNYIVKETVGRFIKEHSPNDIFNIKILDPACGSGSFLIRAYDELLHYHARQQGKSPAELDHSEDRRILLGNIFGVDLDRQAVEITRLSLLLRSLSQREILPGLKDNIRPGNSLISGADEELKKYFGDNWRDKKRFNWEQEFEDIMAQGGFDVVIGNPPYVQSRNIVDDAERHYYWAKYATDTNHSDVFSFFVQKGIALLKDGGFLGLILPATWLQLPSFASMRQILLNSCEIKMIATFESIRVFEDSAIEPLILIAQRMFEPARDNRIVYQRFLEGDGIQPKAIGEIPQVVCKQVGTINLVVDTAKNEIMSKLSVMPKELLQLVYIVGGLRTGADAKYIRPKKIEDEDKPLLRGRNIFRYGYEWAGEYVWYRPDLMKSKQCAAPKEAHFFEAREKLLLRMIVGGQLIAAYDDQQFYLLQDNMLLPKEPKHSLKYVLAILNSKLVQFFLGNTVSNIAVTQSILKQLPIHRIDFNNPKDKKMHDDLVALVDRMLELNKRLVPIRNTSSGEREELLREIKRTDTEIDQKVYELYGLTEEEKQVIETSFVRKSSP